MSQKMSRTQPAPCTVCRERSLQHIKLKGKKDLNYHTVLEYTLSVPHMPPSLLPGEPRQFLFGRKWLPSNEPKKSSILTSGWYHTNTSTMRRPPAKCMSSRCQLDCSEIPLYTAQQQHHQYFYALRSTMYFHAKLIFCFFNLTFSTVPISLQI